MGESVQRELDVETLFAMARDKSAEGRAALVDTITDLFVGGERVLSDKERSLMLDILQQLVLEVEQSVRSALAERLADETSIPRELVVMLANDDIEVAHPILMRSPLLRDPELIEIIHHRTMQHKLSIAMRESISEPVSDELVAQGDETVIRTLLENGGAKISQATLEYLVERSQQIGTYHRPLVHREELGPDLAARMYAWVSAALRKHIRENFDVDPETLEEALGRTVEDLMAEVRTRSRPGHGRPVELAELLGHANALSSRFLIELLREGEIALFEGLFAEMAGLRINLVRRFLYEPGGEALAIACKASRIGKPDFASIFLLSRQARPGDKSVDPEELPRALGIYDRVREDVALGVVRRWRLEPEYLDAIRQLENETPDPREDAKSASC